MSLNKRKRNLGENLTLVGVNQPSNNWTLQNENVLRHREANKK